MAIIKNQKGSVKIAFENYIYTKKATKSTIIRWECSGKKAHDCNGAVTTIQVIDGLSSWGSLLLLQSS